MILGNISFSNKGYVSAYGERQEISFVECEH